MNKIIRIIFLLCCIIIGTAPAIAQPAIGINTETGYEIGAQISDYRYREHVNSGQLFVRETGPEAALTLKAIQAYNSYFLVGDLRAAYGENHYSSPASGRENGLKDYVGEARILAGSDIILWDCVNLTPYTGIGYRNLFNDWSGVTTTGAGGYNRDSQYLYVPIGITPRFRISSQSRLSFNTEYDRLVQGWQRSDLSDSDPTKPDITNKQNGGYGLRENIMYEEKTWSIGPFFNYWNIDKSENKVYRVGATNFVAYEPHNTTTEYGIQATLRF